MALLPTVSLCAGGGGLERGLALAVGPVPVRPVLYVEREAFGVGALVEAMADARLAPAPVWGVLEEIPAPIYGPLRRLAARRLLAFTAGFPCQPHSAAGRRRHTADERWIWPSIATWICRVRPGLVFLENVPGIALDGWDVVVATLAEAGYVAEWDCFLAAEAGSPQKRERIFLVGVLPDAVGELLRLVAERGAGASRSPEPWDSESGEWDEDLADAFGDGRRKGRCVSAWESDAEAQGRAVAEVSQRRRLVDADDIGSSLNEGRESREAGQPTLGCGSTLPRFPPGPTDWRGWRRVVEAGRWDLLPALDEAEEAERPVCGMASRLVDTHRIDGLRLLGNGVVPAQAAIAFRQLVSMLCG